MIPLEGEGETSRGRGEGDGLERKREGGVQPAIFMSVWLWAGICQKTKHIGEL